ncbi:hypothetical protein DET61_11636 [Marinobacter nauticus]|jgi:hypothetical protein|uniref:Uncharacterized protein n=1 Tax=Marinobacter nauticus TaxID=2743 RepID=A0A368X842_MARNT|nr:hypothetical protein DET61_11636 [Marinobacter nauticus]
MDWVQITGLAVIIIGGGVLFYFLDIKKVHKK